MPEISRFFGITISIRFREHPPPHFHAEYSGHLASIRIDKLILHDGSLPPRVLGMVIEWATLHRAELLENWALAQARKRPKKIKPLE